MKNKNFNVNTDEIINSLDGIKRAPAPDFFYTRLRARMDKEAEKGKRMKWMVKPVYALAILSVLLVINAVIIFQNGSGEINTGNPDNENIQAVLPVSNPNDNFLDDIN